MKRLTIAEQKIAKRKQLAEKLLTQLEITSQELLKEWQAFLKGLKDQ